MYLVVEGKDQKNIEIVSLAEISAEDMPKRQKDGVAKLVDGKETYSASGVEVMVNGKKARDTYLSLFNPQTIKRFTPYKLDGTCHVNVYSTREGAIVTITAEKLVPVEEAPAEPKRDLSGIKIGK